MGFVFGNFVGLGLEGRDRGRWVIGGLVGKGGSGWMALLILLTLECAWWVLYFSSSGAFKFTGHEWRGRC